MIVMGGLQLLDGGAEHGNTIVFLGVVGDEHVDVFALDNG